MRGFRMLPRHRFAGAHPAPCRALFALGHERPDQPHRLQRAQFPALVRVCPHRRAGIAVDMADAARQVDTARQRAEDRRHRLRIAENPEVHGVLGKGLRSDVAKLFPVTGCSRSKTFRKLDVHGVCPYAAGGAKPSSSTISAVEAAKRWRTSS